MSIKFHFLNVGHGDTTIVELPDNHLTAIDFNRSNEFDEETAKELAEVYKLNFNALKESSKGYYPEISKYYDITLDDPLVYLNENFPGAGLYRYIQTHPDIDHLAGFKAITECFDIRNFWDTDHKNITKADFRNESDKEDWEHYLKYREDKKLVFYRSFSPITSNNQSYSYNIYVFHPTPEALKNGDSKETPQPNFFSYLILIEYNGFKTILGGDVTEEYWKDLWYWLEKNERAKNLFKGVHVLKASHHGRKSGRCGWEEDGMYNRDFLNRMDPDYVIISVGKKPEGCDATQWYRRRPDGTNRNVLTTRWYGTVWISYYGTVPFARDRIIVETRYERDNQRDYVQGIQNPYRDSNYTLKIRAKISSSTNGPFVEEYKSNGRKLPKDWHLKFYVEKANLPFPYDVKWRVTNTGEEARRARDLRGRIEDDDGSKTKKEHTKYKGTHHMDCFAIKDGVCVAKDRFYVNIA